MKKRINTEVHREGKLGKRKEKWRLGGKKREKHSERAQNRPL